MARFGMVIDLESCMGCRGCMAACKVENSTPEGAHWMYTFRFEAGEFPGARTWFMPRPCMHCDNAPCVKVCPVGARFKREDGLVATDWERCIGCSYCQVACPYGVNAFNYMDPADNYYLDYDEDPDIVKISDGSIPPYRNPDLDKPYGGRMIAGGGNDLGVMEKCTFCVQRVEDAEDPACVQTCPVYALTFGDLDDPESAPSRILDERASFRLLEETGTEPRVYYVGGGPPTSDDRQVEEPITKVEV